MTPNHYDKIYIRRADVVRAGLLPMLNEILQMEQQPEIVVFLVKDGKIISEKSRALVEELRKRLKTHPNP